MDLFRSARGECVIRLGCFYDDIGLDVGAVGFLREVKDRVGFSGGLGKDCALEDIYTNTNTERSVLGYARHSIGRIVTDRDLRSSELRTRRVGMGERAHDFESL